jgi:hypothetical protein
MQPNVIASRVQKGIREAVQAAQKVADVPDVPDVALSKGTPSKPLLGLPLARLIPQDVHSVMDYVDSLAYGSGALISDDPRAQLASVMLAASGAGVSLLTDYRLSAAKVIPIEAHEAIDHIWGLTAIAMPFVLGYWKTSPKVALMHVATGIGTIVSSLFTDYRAYTGRGNR